MKNIETLAVRVTDESKWHPKVIEIISQLIGEFRALGYSIPFEISLDLANFYQEWYDKTGYLELYYVKIKKGEDGEVYVNFRVKTNPKGCLTGAWYNIKELPKWEKEDD